MRRFTCSKIVTSAVLALAGIGANAGPVPGQGTWETTLQARDINGDDVVDAYYDTALDLTWLANANVIGRVTWSDAVNWAANLDVYGVTGWALPSSTITSYGGWGWCDYGAGGRDCGYRPVTTTPMAHMYYETLGNAGYPSMPNGLSNTGPFSNLQANAYWSNDATPNPSLAAWDFNFAEGALNYVRPGYMIFAWATHEGDIAAPVPEPATYALMLAGLGALLMRRRRRI